MSKPAENVNLRTCDREPVHIPGRILAHGILLTVDARSNQVLQSGGDTLVHLGREPQAVLYTPVFNLFTQDSRVALAELLTQAGERPDIIRRLKSVAPHCPDLVATSHRVGNMVVLELEDASLAPAVDISMLQQFCATVQENFTIAADAEVLWQATVRHVRNLTGFDRVMLYRFHEDYSGEVVAEALADNLLPFLGHRYPASDIPEPARKLYLRNWLRCIPDVGRPQSLLYPEDGPGPLVSLDLSHARLRGVSPMHIEYLKNMGVAASLSLSVIVEGRLWGLIACHHYDGPIFFSLELQRALIMIARCLSVNLSVQFAEKAYQNQLDKAHQITLLQQKIRGTQPLEQVIRHIADDLMRLVDAQGVALADGASVSVVGKTPPAEVVTRIHGWLSQRQTGDVHATNALGGEWPPATEFKDTAAGILALRIGGDRNTLIIWFRPEMIVQELWGGDPTRPYTMNPESGAVHPRKSFETYKLEISGLSQSWQDQDFFAVRGLIPLFNAHIIRLAKAEVEKNEKRFRDLVSFNPDAQIVFSRQWEALFLNPAARRLLGDGPDNLRQIVTCIAQNQAELSIPTNTGRVWVEVRAADIGWEGETAHLISLRDITARKQAEQIKDDVQRITQHDLISPLNPIINLPMLMADDQNITEDQKEMLAAIRKAGERMREMIDLSLNLYKMEMGVFSFVPMDVNLLEIFAEILTDQSHKLQRGNVSVRIMLDGKEAGAGDGFFILGDKTLCYSMFANLMLNSVEASRPGDLVTVSLSAGTQAEVAIHNTLPVPKDIRETFFEKYVTHGKSKGTGLGTYSARLIARTLGGDIALESSRTLGTVVTVCLPLAESAQSRRAAHDADRPPVQTSVQSATPETGRERPSTAEDKALEFALSKLKREVDVNAFTALKTAKKAALLTRPDSVEHKALKQVIACLAGYNYPESRTILDNLLADLEANREH